MVYKIPPGGGGKPYLASGLYSKKNDFNFKPKCRTYPSEYLIRLRDDGQDTIFVKGRWCINQESESCPSCSQHIVFSQHFAKDRQFNSEKSRVIVSVYSTLSWWDISFRDLSLKLHKSILAVVELWPYIHKLTTKEQTDGRTNTMFIERSLSTGRAMCWR